MKRFLLILAAVALASLPSGRFALADCPCRAPELMESFITIDSHVDIPSGYATDSIDPGQRSDKLQVDLVKMAEGGLDCVFLVSYVAQGPLTVEGFARAKQSALEGIEAIRRFSTRMYPERVGLALSPVDVVNTVSSGRSCVVLGLENGYPVGEDLGSLREFHDLGVRYVTLSHVGHNQICDSANERVEPVAPGQAETLDEAGNKVMRFLSHMETIYSPEQAPPRWNGLSPFGERVVREMNDLGMMIDLSHVSDSTFFDVLRLSRAPVILSHSTCRAIAGLARSVSDEQIEALARNGGVIQINALAAYVKFPRAQYREMSELRKGLGGERARERLFHLLRTDRAAYDSLTAAANAVIDSLSVRWPRPSVADFVDHIDHVINLVGEDHVGIGTDFDGGGGIKGLENASDYANITEEMIIRGYSIRRMAKIWGDNLLRVWSEVEKCSAAASSSR